MLLLALLTPEPQAIAQLCKRLRMKKPELEAVIAQHKDALITRGMVLHVAPKSEIARAIKLPSQANPNEPTYYSRISKEQP